MRRMVFLERVIWGLFLIIGLSTCASVSKVHPPVSDEAGALRLAEVMALATRQEILTLGVHYDYFLASGIKDSDLRDGSIGAGRVYCCGGPPEQDSAIWFYIPTGVNVEPGNIVEVRMGRQPGKNDRGTVNTVVRIRYKDISQGPCRWVPEKEGLWMRILHCDWMEEEGWIERGGLWKTWLKPVS